MSETKKMETGFNILTGLRKPGKILIFVDETGTSGQPISSLVTDFMLYCGVEINSEYYADISLKMEMKLKNLAVSIVEFHSTEIVNPKKDSDWFNVSMEERSECLQFLGDILFNYSNMIFFCYIGRDQFENIMYVHAKNLSGLNQKTGLKKVFFNSLLSQNSYTGKEIAIILDSEKCLTEEIKLQKLSTQIKVYQDSVIIVGSEVEPGLQLADFAAFLLNRSFHLVERAKEGKNSLFDNILTDIFVKLSHKFIDILK